MIKLPCGAEADEEVDCCIHCPRGDQCMYEAKLTKEFYELLAELEREPRHE